MTSFKFLIFPSGNIVWLSVLQHQQQVVQAVERAKQVTMAELNAVIGVRGLPGLPPTVCILLFHHYFIDTVSLCLIMLKCRQTKPHILITLL